MPARRDFRLLRWLAAIYRLSRGGNLFLLGTSLYLAAIFLVAPWFSVQEKLLSIRLLIAVSATAAVTAAGYIINDYFDVRTDRINKPGRSLVGRHITRRWTLALHLLLTAGGLLVSWPISKTLFALELIAASLLWIYSAWLKATPFWGNLLVAALAGAALLVPGIVFWHFPPALLAFMAFAFFSNLVREVIKDMEDMQGDALAGCRTLPLVWGLPRTRALVQGLLSLFAIIILVSSAWLSLPLLVYNINVIGTITVMLVKLPSADTKSQFRKLSRVAKIMFVQGMLGMAVMII